MDARDTKHGFLDGRTKRIVADEPWLPSPGQAERGRRLRERHEREKGPRWEIDEETGCWIRRWSVDRSRMYVEARGALLPDGRRYGRGWHLHHLCRVTDCVNPDHQAPLTVREHSRHHVDLERAGWRELPVPERVRLSARLIDEMRSST